MRQEKDALARGLSYTVENRGKLLFRHRLSRLQVDAIGKRCLYVEARVAK